MALLEITFKIGDEQFTTLYRHTRDLSRSSDPEEVAESFLRSYGFFRGTAAEVTGVRRVHIPTSGLKANSAMLEVLETIINKLEVFIQPGNPMCGVDREHREAARPYIGSWVLAPLLAVRDEMNRTTNIGDRIRSLAH